MASRLGTITGAIVVASLAWSGFARAETMSYADAMTVLVKDCGADVKKFCKGINLGNNGVQNCLAKNQAKVSPTCTTTLAAVNASISRRAAAQVNVFQICKGDALRVCAGVNGNANIVKCLINKRNVSEACEATIVDAGWR